MNNIETTFIWQDANLSLPPTNQSTSDYILFIFNEEIHFGYLDCGGLFYTKSEVTNKAVAVAPFKPEGEAFGPWWKFSLDDGTLPLVTKWVYLTDTYPKLDLTKDRLIREYELLLESENEIGLSILNRSVDLVSQIYQLTKSSFQVPKVSSDEGKLIVTWEQNYREVRVVFREGRDTLVCESANVYHEFFPFTVEKVVEWLEWVNRA